MEGDVLLYPVGGRVDADGAALGYVVERRRISNPTQTQQTVALLSGLIGNEASIVIGNQDGSAWTNLSKPVTGIPITARRRRTAVGLPARRHAAHATRGRRRFQLTPWIIAIEFPRAAVLAPTRAVPRRARSAIATSCC